LTESARRSLVVDTSAAVAIVLGEPGSEELLVRLEAALARLMSAAIRVELGIVIEARLWPAGQDVVDRFLRDAKIDIVPVDADLAARAMSGWRRYGKGRHPAGLNFGDCFTYALAERTGHPVLCTGDDFAATGISVLRPPAGNGDRQEDGRGELAGGDVGGASTTARSEAKCTRRNGASVRSCCRSCQVRRRG
jgi:ribonuclease VapC